MDGKTVRRWELKHVRDVVKLMPDLKRIEEEYNRRKMAVVSEVLGYEVELCHKCSRPMLQRRLWDMLPQDVRETGVLTRRYTSGICQTHRAAQRRTSRRVIKRHRTSIEQLQAQVGFNPDKDYDAEDERADETA